MQVIPAVDVMEGEVVRLVEGDFDKATTYSDDPVDVVRRWCDQGATLVHVVDLDGARHGRSRSDVWQRMAEAGLPIQVGGGIRDVETIRSALEVGVERVVVGTMAVAEPERLAEVADLVDRVVAAVDVREGRARGSGWTDTGRSLNDVLNGLAGNGVGRVLLTGIERDGTMSGPDLDLTSTVIDDGRFAVVASGGVGSLQHLADLSQLGCEAAIVGKALYEHRFTFAEAQAAAGIY
ncbi:MAG: 1-(5-phosphoribosyl)-5-((5-phosphoribosylamino)methylideneamino)imidazole-4-carboxamide isomerase [Acidimicrobiia bacterium]|nr:1-(5-phosphoribosyl)-5-((5-phosphoribosylamino)methylideneamino)imidazole-4-carboxamide isomerase [Acidimicrobiia bacterium]